MNMNKLIENLYTMIQPIVERLGYELYHLEYVKEDRENYLRIYIDNENGISLDDCEKVSREISSLLDSEDPISDAYFLEVSSPGIDRMLYSDEHLKKNIGNKVNIRLNKSLNGKKLIKGNLLDFDLENIKIDSDSKEIIIPRQNVKSINLEGEI